MTEPLTHRFLPRELHPAVDALLVYLTEGPFAPPEKCPWCGSLHFNGGGNQQQRYWCKQCQRSFFPTSGTPFSNCRHPEKWAIYARYRLAGYTYLQASQFSGLTTYSGLHRETVITQILSERWPQLLPWWQGQQHQTQGENPLRTTPFTSKEDAWAHHNHEYVQCLECGKMFSFLATHLRKAHGITAQAYREKWQIMKQIPLAGFANRRGHSAAIKAKIKQGEVDPLALAAAMQAANKQKGRKKRFNAAYTSQQHGERLKSQKLWETSPAIKIVDEATQRAAASRMQRRRQTGEPVQAIADEFGVAKQTLYVWVKRWAEASGR